jgi:hypothetical protein
MLDELLMMMAVMADVGLIWVRLEPVHHDHLREDLIGRPLHHERPSP